MPFLSRDASEESLANRTDIVIHIFNLSKEKRRYFCSLVTFNKTFRTILIAAEMKRRTYTSLPSLSYNKFQNCY